MDFKFIPEPSTTTIYHSTKVTQKEKLHAPTPLLHLICWGILLGTAVFFSYLLMNLL